MIQLTPAVVKPPTVSVTQSQVAFKIATAIHLKNQPTSDDGLKGTYDMIPERIRDIGKRTYPTLTTKDNKKRKKKVQHRSRVSNEECGKSSKDKETFGATFGMQMIAD